MAHSDEFSTASADSQTLFRVFLAIPLPPQLKDSISALQRQLQRQIPYARWVPPKNLHLTLHFFGEIEQETLEKIKVSVLSVKGCKQPFLVEVKGLGAFPDRDRPRILWLDLEPKDQLRQLHQDCSKALHRAGVSTDPRPYAPHLTIGRLRQQKTDLTDLYSSIGQRRIGQWPINRLVLFKSRLQPGGAEHIPLLTVSLDENDNP
jgi:2'-5' RNA ligase